MGEGRAVREVRARWAESPSILAGALVVAAVLLGGASRENSIRLAIVELVALPVAALALRALSGARVSRRARLALIGLGLIVAVPILQLIPLPPSLWMAAPGQGPRVEALSLAGVAAPWLPLSLSPRETLVAALALAAPAAMFLGSLRLRTGDRRRLTGLWLAVAAVGLALGVAQIAAPRGGLAYPYRTTNLGSLVGWFANRNHEAGFLLALLPFAAALAGSTAEARRPRVPGEAPALASGPWLAGLFFLMALVALGVIRSRAGIILAAPALAVSLLILWRARWARRASSPPRIATLTAFAAATAISAAAIALFGLTPILDRFTGTGQAEFRFEAWPHVAAAAHPFLPLGAGLGAFDRVFRAAEPLTFVGPTYFNHAHNDYLELWLETGWIGAALLAGFLLWYGAAVGAAWRSGGDPLARAASVAIALLLAQSVVDYPLRTETLACLFAFCCALLIPHGGRDAAIRERR